MIDKKKAVLITIVGGLVFFTMLVIGRMINSKSEFVPSNTSVKYKIDQSSQEDSKPIFSAKITYEVAPEKEKPVEFSLDPTKHELKDQSDFENWATKDFQSHFQKGSLDNNNYAFLMSFRDYLKTHFPEDWHTMLDKILKKEFPHHTNKIKKVYDKIDKYDGWFESNRNLLATMTADEIKAALWQKRKELFGEDAEQIWNSNSKVEQFQDTIAVFNDASHISIEDKLQVFESLWARMPSNGKSDKSDQIHKYHMAFMDLDSVQTELAQLDPAKRAESLVKIRKAMGYDDAKIEEMTNFDAYEDQQWEKGRTYMSERDDIVQQFTGSEREQQLRLLRERYFKNEANIIATEEASNYFRFRQKRIYGHN